MLIQMLIARPQMIGPILAGTPSWVWFLLAGLVGLGVSQFRTRTLSAIGSTIKSEMCFVISNSRLF